jgi:ARG and Rhodanese-Phosphatase-superfamily-associated Protein domain
MRPRTIAFLTAAVVFVFMVQLVFVVALVRHMHRPAVGPAAGGFAFAPAPAFQMQVPDEMFIAPGMQPGQPITAEELQVVRCGPAKEAKFEVSAPVTHANLSVFFIHGPAAAAEPKVITLQDALNQGLATVHDQGMLTVDNRSNLPLFIQGGDIVKGGNQDRVLPYDYMIPAGAMRSPVAAFCVEAGRSRPRGNELSSSFEVSSAQLPTKSLKMAALHRRSQQDVWNGVSQTQSNLGQNLGAPVKAQLSQTSLQLTLEHPRVQEAAQPYLEKLAVLPDKGNVVGYAIAVNGRIHSADVYGSSDLFRQLWPKLIQAGVIEALAEQQPRADVTPPSAEAVQAFLKDAEQGQAYRQTGAIQVQIRQESAQALLFETCDAGRGNLMVHRCYLAK